MCNDEMYAAWSVLMDFNMSLSDNSTHTKIAVSFPALGPLI